MEMTVNSIDDIIKLLKSNKITPLQAVNLASEGLGLVRVNFSNAPAPNKIDVLNQLKLLDNLVSDNGRPIAFWQTSKDFNIKDIAKT